MRLVYSCPLVRRCVGAFMCFPPNLLLYFTYIKLFSCQIGRNRITLRVPAGSSWNTDQDENQVLLVWHRRYIPVVLHVFYHGGGF